MKSLFILTAFLLTSLKSNQDSKLVEPVECFYSWYITEQYLENPSYYQVPDFEKIGKKSYVFNLTQFQARLDKIPYFSESYKTKLIDQLIVCNEKMQKYEWDFEPEPMFNLEPCNYLWGDQWVGGQGENISDFEIDNIDFENKIVIVQIFIDDNPFVKSTVKLQESSDGYKISDINLEW